MGWAMRRRPTCRRTGSSTSQSRASTRQPRLSSPRVAGPSSRRWPPAGTTSSASIRILPVPSSAFSKVNWTTEVLAKLVLATALLLFPATASADSYFAVKGAPAPGPAKYDKVWVQQIGPASAKHVLVLLPGTQGAAGSLTFAGRDVQAALGSDWQVWIEDRREVVFDDLTGFRSGDPSA